MDIRAKLQEKLGEPVTQQEFEFAVGQFENNKLVVDSFRKGRIYDDTAMDILATNIDFFRRHNIGGAI